LRSKFVAIFLDARAVGIRVDPDLDEEVSHVDVLGLASHRLSCGRRGDGL
jgi:hypothetical protein